MAQTGYTPILIYSSSTAAQAPAAGNLTNSTLGSELAINITDGKLFYKDNANNVQVIAWKTTPTTAGGTGLTSYTAGDLLYYATGTTLSKLAIGANTTVLTSSGTAPQWTAQSALSVGTAANLLSNATTGVMQIVGPGAGTTRVMTIPNANFTAARTDAGQTFTGTQAFAGITATNASVATGSTVIVAGATSGSAATLQSGTGTFSLTGANNRGIGVLVNSNQNTNITLPYGGSFEVFGLLSGVKAVAGGNYTLYGLAGYAESDGPAIGVRADAKANVAANPAYGLYVGSVTGATNNYGIYVADTAAQNYLAGNLSFASGKGIDFSATAGTGTSELLADYEEGTWTPTITGSTSAGTGTYTTQIGRYVKIGSMVYCQAYILWTNHTGTGNLWLTGLPYTLFTTTDNHPSGSIGLLSNVALTAGNIATTYGSPNTTRFNLVQYPTGGGAASSVPIDTAGEIIYSVCYYAA